MQTEVSEEFDELIGRTVGSYRVERMLGKGGMGAVYEGVHPVIGSRVAIKFLHPKYAHEQRIVDRFFNEARAVNVIGHDNILKILDLSVTDEGAHYFVMEFLDGRPLQALCKSGEPVGLDVTGPIILQCCDALEAAHRRGIVHRDLKPDNIYLIALNGRRNFVKVVDFGIARLTDDAGDSQGSTQAGMVMGTPAYMSPEQGSGDIQSIDGRSDVYSLGIVMYQLATGRLPFPGSNFGEILVGHLQKEPPPPHQFAPDIPEQYEAIILRCLAKSQDERFQSMRELKDALAQCMDELGVPRELPFAETDDSKPGHTLPAGTPGPRTPMRAGATSNPGLRSSPGARSNPGLRGSNPGARNSSPGARNSNPGARNSSPGVRGSTPAARSSPSLQPAPRKGPSMLLIGGGALAACAVLGIGAFLVFGGEAPKPAPKPRPKIASVAPDPEPAPPPRATSVTLSVTGEPQDAAVTATWTGGEKRGVAPLEIEAPLGARVHFEFSKSGFAAAALDVTADASQPVKAVLQPEQQAVAGEPETPRAHHVKKHADAPKPEAKQPAKDGLIDLDDSLK